MRSPAAPAKLLREAAAGAALSTLVGLAFVFLMFIGRREMWTWRLAVYGALGGFVDR